MWGLSLIHIYHYEDTKAWGSGNEVPMAALIVGSQTNAYKANAVCTVTDTEISAPEDKSKPAVYVSSNNDTQTGTTYTSQLNISGEKTKITGDMVAADGKADEPTSVIVKDNAVITGNITNNSVASAIAVIDGAAVSGTTTVKESKNGTIFVEGTVR